MTIANTAKVGHRASLPGSGNIQKVRQKNSRFRGWSAVLRHPQFTAAVIPAQDWASHRPGRVERMHETASLPAPLPKISKHLLVARGGKDIFFSGGGISKVPMLCK